MTVGELIKHLRNFPPQFPVFMNAGQPEVFAPQEVKMNLVDLSSMRQLPYGATSAAGFSDSVVISSEIDDREGMIYFG